MATQEQLDGLLSEGLPRWGDDDVAKQKQTLSMVLHGIKRWLQTRPSKGKDKIKVVRPSPDGNMIRLFRSRGVSRWNPEGRGLDFCGGIATNDDGDLVFSGYFSFAYDIADPNTVQKLQKDFERICGAELEEIHDNVEDD